MKNAPNRIGMPDEFGVVKNGKIEARFEMGTHFIQTLGADESPGEYRIDRDHVFVQVLIEREAQDLDVVEQLPNAEEIGFVLRLDVPLSYASVP